MNVLSRSEKTFNAWKELIYAISPQNENAFIR